MVIESKIREIVATQCLRPVSSATNGATIRADLGADSLTLVLIGLELEAEYGRPVSNEDLDQMHTVEDVITYVMSRAA